MFGFKERRRKKLRNRPFPPEWLAILRRNVPYYCIIPPEDREELQGLVQVFLAEKYFEGCGGVEITDEIRVTIAAQACILLLHRRTDLYPGLTTILVYPAAYVVHEVTQREDGTVLEGEEARLGESWEHGTIVLSWDDVLTGAADFRDGRNVVFHEFAHQLDEEWGGSDGAPRLPERSMYIAWARVLGREYDGLIQDIARRRATLLDRYGAESPAEFFAVVTEFLFERARGCI
ncbi:MAG: zinc-dependent peptidase [Acidobacteriota bacterium]